MEALGFLPFLENKFIAENPKAILGHGGGRKWMRDKLRKGDLATS